MESASQFTLLAMFLVFGGIFAALLLGVNKLLAPFRPNPEKNTSYECGEEPMGGAVLQFNSRFYVVGLIFLVFEVELLFLFPWITVFAEKTYLQALPAWGWLALGEAGVFMAVLILGLAYVWVSGDLDWIKPEPVAHPQPEAAKLDRYASINLRYAGTHAPTKS